MVTKRRDVAERWRPVRPRWVTLSSVLTRALQNRCARRRLCGRFARFDMRHSPCTSGRSCHVPTESEPPRGARHDRRCGRGDDRRLRLVVADESHHGCIIRSTSGGTSGGACAVTRPRPRVRIPIDSACLATRRSSVVTSRKGRPGLPLALTLTIVNTASGCTAVANANVEIWQCDAAGNYSEYAQPGYDGTGQTFLRGLQIDRCERPGDVQDGLSRVVRRSRHAHPRRSVRQRPVVKTTQIAFPEDVSAQVYASGVYAAKGQNPTHNASDNVFSDGTTTELATVSGSVATGYTATLTIGVTV